MTEGIHAKTDRVLGQGTGISVLRGGQGEMSELTGQENDLGIL